MCVCTVCYHIILCISLALIDIKVFADGIYLVKRKKKISMKFTLQVTGLRCHTHFFLSPPSHLKTKFHWCGFWSNTS